LAAAPAGALLIDCSTIDVETARDVARAAEGRDWPCSTRRCRAGSPARKPRRSPSCRGPDEAFERARPVLEAMARPSSMRRRRKRAGRQDLQQHGPRRLDDRGVGGVPAGREARPRRPEAVRYFLEVVGPVLVDDELLPGAGPVPASPANRDYKAGFTATMMLKDLKLAQEAARATRTSTPLGAGRQRSTSSSSKRRTAASIFRDHPVLAGRAITAVARYF